MYNEQYRVIEKSYNENTYYENYRQHRQLTEMERYLLVSLIERMPTEERKVLDVGCGDAGLFDTYLRKQCFITGIDISIEQIKRARNNVPDGNFIHGNFLDMSIDSSLGCYDGIICMYALFNFMEVDQKKALRLMHELLSDAGVALINIRKEKTATIKYAIDWCGKPMYWSLPGVTQTLIWCTEVGFSCEIYPNPDNPDYVFAMLHKQ